MGLFKNDTDVEFEKITHGGQNDTRVEKVNNIFVIRVIMLLLVLTILMNDQENSRKKYKLSCHKNWDTNKRP